MPDLLLELFSEEIPARMQARAADDLRKMVTDRLVNAGLVYEGAKAFATPRRLALAVHGVPARQPDVKEERKGPRVGAPEGAIAGFLKAAGLTSISQAKVQPDKKGDFYIAVTEKPGRAAIDVIAGIVPEVVRAFPWPKSMRWGAGELTWVRPLHSILATFGPETEEPEVVRFSVEGIAAGDFTRGHRFLAPAEFKVRRLDDYVAKLQAAKVVLDPARRAEIILADAKHLAFAQGYELIEDAGLLAEVAGLVEWPVLLMGSFDEAFLAIPPEVIRTTIRNNQKCFVVQKLGGGLANRFVLTANTEAQDGGAAIVAGNERVIRARLSDAKFFYETDLKTKLEDRLEKLKEIVFHEKLGTQYERVERIERLARELAPIVGADPDKAARAARLAKADLVTEMVGEFPELQGLMGKYYALAQGEDASVAAACEDHYKPLGPNDRVPTDPVSIAVALADKIDTLVGFWAIDEKPTGSKDPYALRRAALGVIKIAIEEQRRISLRRILSFAQNEIISAIVSRAAQYDPEKGIAAQGDIIFAPIQEMRMFSGPYSPGCRSLTLVSGPSGNRHSVLQRETMSQIGLFKNEELLEHLLKNGEITSRDLLVGFLVVAGDPALAMHPRHQPILLPSGLYYVGGQQVQGASGPRRITPLNESLFVTSGDGTQYVPTNLLADELLDFFADRLKVQLREQGARHDLVDAVFALEGQDDLVLIVRRVEALGKFLDTDSGKSLLAGVKRATNIIRIEEKKDGREYRARPDPSLYLQKEERELAVAISAAKTEAQAAIAREDFAAAMHAIATLRPFVDAFFEKVTVNVEMADRRENRLKLLNEIREATRAVADFSKIEG